MQPYLARAWHCIEVKNWQLALRELQAVVGQHGQDAQVHYLIGFCLMRLGQYPAAEAAVRQALSLQPNWAHVHNLLADLLLLGKQYEEAATCLEQSLQLDATKSDTYRALASLQYAREDYTAALKASELGLHYNADDVPCLVLRANSLRMLKRPLEAEEAYREVLRRDPEHAEAHAMLGWIDYEVERGDQSAEHFQTALRLNPTDGRARRNYVNVLKSRHLRSFARWLNHSPFSIRCVVVLLILLWAAAFGRACQLLPGQLLPLLLVPNGSLLFGSYALYEVAVMRNRELQFFLNATDRRESWVKVSLLGVGVVLAVISFGFTNGLAAILPMLGLSLCLVGLVFDGRFFPFSRRQTLSLAQPLAAGLAFAILPLSAWALLTWNLHVEPFRTPYGAGLALLTFVSPAVSLFAALCFR